MKICGISSHYKKALVQMWESGNGGCPTLGVKMFIGSTYARRKWWVVALRRWRDIVVPDSDVLVPRVARGDDRNESNEDVLPGTEGAEKPCRRVALINNWNEKKNEIFDVMTYTKNKNKNAHQEHALVLPPKRREKQIRRLRHKSKTLKEEPKGTNLTGSVNRL